MASGGARGVYVGDNSARTREMIRDQVTAFVEHGDAVMIWPASTDQGFEFATHGKNRRMPADFNGLELVHFLPKNGSNAGRALDIEITTVDQSVAVRLFPVRTGMNRS